MPRLSCSGAESTVSVWVGLGGNATADDLIQVGTESACTAGVEHVWVWSQHGPRGRSRPYANIAVKAGDRVVAEVSREGSHRSAARVEINGVTQLRGGFDGHIGSTTTSECIVEHPSSFDGQATGLAEFHSVRFSECGVPDGAKVRSARPESWGAIEQFDGNTRLTDSGLPGRLGAFTVRRLSTDP